jgi:hypothetical protein
MRYEGFDMPRRACSNGTLNASMRTLTAIQPSLGQSLQRMTLSHALLQRRALASAAFMTSVCVLTAPANFYSPGA